ncbi:hypothetical protein GCK32_022638 [Trichostrongylus colubriformis]|uniref:Uncharacterized protein n=1 Tax=Trichostrongylus colubriformis TaxID=6319 RepID=A0AAN8IBE1_TRICO
MDAVEATVSQQKQRCFSTCSSLLLLSVSSLKKE